MTVHKEVILANGSMFTVKHLVTSILNSLFVTLTTNIVLIEFNHPTAEVWLRNWLIAWGIVFLYVYLIAHRVKVLVHGHD